MCLDHFSEKRVKYHIMQASAIEQSPISQIEFYWTSYSEPTTSGGLHTKGLETADRQSSPEGIYNGEWICILMRNNETAVISCKTLARD